MISTRRQALSGLVYGVAGIALGGEERVLASVPAPVLRLDPASRLEQGGWARGRVSKDGKATLDGKPVGVDAQGRFFLGFDRDAGLVEQLSAYFEDGAFGKALHPSFVMPLAITPQRWPTEAIDAPFHPPGLPDAAFMKIRAGELAQIVAARARGSDASGWAQSFAWPVDWQGLGGRISGQFGAQRIYRGTPGTYHSGIDMAVGAGTPWMAPADGVVSLAAEAPFSLEGRLLILDHGMGLNSAFLHSEELLVTLGDRVVQGQHLGLVGRSGRATGPHLHWGLMWCRPGEGHGARLDPRLLVTGADEGHAQAKMR